MKESKYFRQAIADVNQNYLAADGWNNFDNWGGADGFGAVQQNLGADAAAPVSVQNQGSKALPYIIQVENTTTATVSDITILNSAVTFNNYAVSGVSITYGLSGVTYNTFLGRVNSGQSFEVGQLRIIASSTTTGRDELQVLQPVTVFTRTIDGRYTSMQLTLQKDSFQQIKNQVDSYYPFLVDSMTGLTFSLYGSTTVVFYFFPKAAVNPFNQLRGDVLPTTYANPRTNFSLKG